MINETNIQSSNSDIGNENGRRRGYDVCGKGEIIHSEESSTESDIDTDNLVLNGSIQNDNDLNKSFITRKTKVTDKHNITYLKQQVWGKSIDIPVQNLSELMYGVDQV